MTLRKARLDRFFFSCYIKKDGSQQPSLFSLSFFHLFIPKRKLMFFSVVCSVTQRLYVAYRTLAFHSLWEKSLILWYDMAFNYYLQLWLIEFLGDKYSSRSVKDALSLIMLSAKFKTVHSYWMKSLFTFCLVFCVDWFLPSSTETGRTPQNKFSINVIKISCWEEERNPRNTTAEAKASVRATFLSHQYQEASQRNF